MTKLFPNPEHITVWHKASRAAVAQNPDNQAVLLVQLGLTKLYNLYVQKPSIAEHTMGSRQKIFNYFKEAAQTGDARGMFFEGLCRLFGFGCNTDALTGGAFIRVAAIARGCDLAINYLQLRLGVAYLNGNNMPQNYKRGIGFLIAAGQIARTERAKLAEHFSSQQLRLQSPQEEKQKPLRTSYRP